MGGGDNRVNKTSYRALVTDQGGRGGLPVFVVVVVIVVTDFCLTQLRLFIVVFVGFPPYSNYDRELSQSVAPHTRRIDMRNLLCH